MIRELFHVMKPTDSRRVRCHRCRRASYACEHVHWNTGNTRGVSFFYTCKRHTAPGILAAIRYRRDLAQARLS